MKRFGLASLLTDEEYDDFALECAEDAEQQEYENTVSFFAMSRAEEIALSGKMSPRLNADWNAGRVIKSYSVYWSHNNTWERQLRWKLYSIFFDYFRRKYDTNFNPGDFTKAMVIEQLKLERENGTR